jgi:lipoprotein signal peptidase
MMQMTGAGFGSNSNAWILFICVDGAVALMAIVVFVFVRDVHAAVWVIQALFTICTGALGRQGRG